MLDAISRSVCVLYPEQHVIHLLTAWEKFSDLYESPLSEDNPKRIQQLAVILTTITVGQNISEFKFQLKFYDIHIQFKYTCSFLIFAVMAQTRPLYPITAIRRSTAQYGWRHIWDQGFQR